jgi:hypothetical protein
VGNLALDGLYAVVARRGGQPEVHRRQRVVGIVVGAHDIPMNGGLGGERDMAPGVRHEQHRDGRQDGAPGAGSVTIVGVVR